jgi:hypothetical protein
MQLELQAGAVPARRPTTLTREQGGQILRASLRARTDACHDSLTAGIEENGNPGGRGHHRGLEISPQEEFRAAVLTLPPHRPNIGAQPAARPWEHDHSAGLTSPTGLTSLVDRLCWRLATK